MGKKIKQSLHQRRREKQLTWSDVGNLTAEMTRTRICTDILLLSILPGNLTGKKSQRAAKGFWNQRALKATSENRAVFPSALNLLLLMRKQALVWVNVFDQRGHLIYPSHWYWGTLSKLTLSLSSTYKWEEGKTDPIYPCDWWELLQAELKIPASAHPPDRVMSRCESSPSLLMLAVVSCESEIMTEHYFAH